MVHTSKMPPRSWNLVQWLWSNHLFKFGLNISILLPWIFTNLVSTLWNQVMRRSIWRPFLRRIRSNWLQGVEMHSSGEIQEIPKLRHFYQIINILVTISGLFTRSCFPLAPNSIQVIPASIGQVFGMDLRQKDGFH